MTLAARLGDTTAHGGKVVMGCPTVLIGNMPAARIGDSHVCPMLTGVVPHVGGPVIMGAFTERLATVASTDAGRVMLEKVNASGKQMTVVEFTGPNSFCGPTNNSGWVHVAPKGDSVFYGNGAPATDAAGNQLIGTGKGAD